MNLVSKMEDLWQAYILKTCRGFADRLISDKCLHAGNRDSASQSMSRLTGCMLSKSF